MKTSKKALAALLAGLVAVSVVGGELPAFAAGTYPTLAAANIRSQPTTASTILRTVAKGTQLTIDCYETGQAVSGVTIWNHLTSGGYISDTLLLTGSNNPVVPKCLAGLPVVTVPVATPVKYNRQAAISWALAHVYDKERYALDDCTWYVSQALWAGSLPKSGSWTDVALPLLKPNFNAVNADGLKNYLVNESRQATIQQLSWGQNGVAQAQLGDLIAYDWNADGKVDHMMIITAFSGQYPLVSGHSVAAKNQGWTWSNSYGTWYQSKFPKSRVYLVHITK